MSCTWTRRAPRPITSDYFYRVDHSRIAIYAKHEALLTYNTEAETARAVVKRETYRRGGELRECTKPPLSSGNRGVLCAFRHRGIMHRAHDRPTDRQIVEQGRAEDRAPRWGFPPSGNPCRSRLSAGLNEPDPENIISNPSEGKIYESSSLRIVLELAPRRLQSLGRKKYTFQHGISVRVVY